MIERLKFIGWWALMIIVCLLTVVFTIALAPVWPIVWLITGWFFPREVMKWMERTFPPEVVNK